MWTVKQHATGYWYCQSSRTDDTTDQHWATEAEAQSWATVSNAAEAQRVAEAKARAARRRPRVEMPTDFATSRGDGWEGNG